MGIGRVYRCAAVGAEGVRAFVAAFGGFAVDPGSSGSQKETGRERLYGDPIGRAGERLTISAVTDSYSAGVDFGCKRNLAAVATAFDVHGCPRAYNFPVSPDYRT